MRTYRKTCPWCNRGFIAHRSDKRCCSKNCYQRVSYWENPEPTRARARAEAQRNAVRRKAKYREWYQANRERQLRYNKEYLCRVRSDAQARERLRERARINSRRYRAQDPERVRDYYRGRRDRQNGAAGKHTRKQWAARVEFYGWRCAYCRRALTVETLTQDHAIPLIRGGTQWASNLLPACGGCNSSKRAKTYSEYAAWREAA